MTVVNFIIGIIALIIGVLAYRRAGGVKELRESTATMLSKMEAKVREAEKAESKGQKEQKPSSY